MALEQNLVWIDLEMTGLDPERCVIVEIATIVTDGQLNTVAEGPCHIIHQPQDVLDCMDPEVISLHSRSGLLPKIAASEIRLEQAEAETLSFIKQHCAKQTAPLCGNSIWKDRQFIERYMHDLSGFLHYRNIDVSTLKELARRWYPGVLNPPKKQGSHRALDDIRESIAELKYYRNKLFVEKVS